MKRLLLIFLALFIAFSPVDSSSQGKKKGHFISKSIGGGIVAGATVNLDAGNAASYPGSGTDWFDLTANNNDGVLTNGVGYDAGDGGVLTFDGFNDYIAGHSTPQVNDSAPFTVEVWFNLDVINGGSSPFRNIFLLETAHSNGFAFAITPTGQFSGYGTMVFGSATSFDQLKLTDAISISTWYQAVITFDGSNPTSTSGYKFYLNSVSKTVQSSSAFAGNNNINTIGWESPSGLGQNYLDGKLPIFNLYNNKEFNQTEVTQNFDFYKDRFGF